LTRAVIFLVVTIDPGAANCAAVRSLCRDLAALLRTVGFREPAENLSCVMGFGSEAWDRLFGEPRPAELHPFREIEAGGRHAVATPGDVLFHPGGAHGFVLRIGGANHGGNWGRGFA
jgi:putative iron-dependent peroxidase